jgi:hypothetical protein
MQPCSIVKQTDSLNTSDAFNRWQEAHSDEAKNVRVASCLLSPLTSARNWKQQSDWKMPEKALHYRAVMRSQLKTMRIVDAEYIIWPYFPERYVSDHQLTNSLVVDFCIPHSGHFGLTVIKCPTEPDGDYIFFTFDSFLSPMPLEAREAFALMLMDVAHCNEKPQDSDISVADVCRFAENRIVYIPVTVCKPELILFLYFTPLYQTTKQTGTVACGFFVIYWVQQLLKNWPPREVVLVSFLFSSASIKLIYFYRVPEGLFDGWMAIPLTWRDCEQNLSLCSHHQLNGHR